MTLGLLASFASREAVLEAFDAVFRCVVGRALPSAVQASWQPALSDSQAAALFDSVRAVVLAVLRNGGDAADALRTAAAGGAEVDARVQQLVAKVLAGRHAAWAAQAAQESRSLYPRLVDVQWRADVKMAAKELTRMAVPAAFVDLTLQPVATRADELPPVDHVRFEMSREALQTMLDNLGRIKAQLDAVKQQK